MHCTINGCTLEPTSCSSLQGSGEFVAASGFSTSQNPLVVPSEPTFLGAASCIRTGGQNRKLSCEVSDSESYAWVPQLNVWQPTCYAYFSYGRDGEGFGGEESCLNWGYDYVGSANASLPDTRWCREAYDALFAGMVINGVSINATTTRTIYKEMFDSIALPTGWVDDDPGCASINSNGTQSVQRALEIRGSCEITGPAIEVGGYKDVTVALAVGAHIENGGSYMVSIQRQTQGSEWVNVVGERVSNLDEFDHLIPLTFRPSPDIAKIRIQVTPTGHHFDDSDFIYLDNIFVTRGSTGLSGLATIGRDSAANIPPGCVVETAQLTLAWNMFAEPFCT